jgi:chitinase
MSRPIVMATVLVTSLSVAACGSDSDSSGSGGTGATTATGGSGGSGGTTTSGGSGGASGSAGSVATGGSAGSGGTSGASGKWAMGYYASWQATQYPVSAVEWSGMTHVAMSFYTPGTSSPLSLLGGNPSVAKDLVDAAHAHGVKAIASIGGADSRPDFLSATANMTAFVQALVALLDTPGYDGIDIDWEPLEDADHATVIAIADQVRAARPNAALTIPIGYQNVNLAGNLSGYATIAAAYDQLNIMSYGMAGAWTGWKSWHSSPLYHQDSATPTSIDSSVKLYVAAGVPKAKLGVGIGFYGLCYTPPVDGPDQDLGGSTLAAGDGAMSYENIMTQYYVAAARKWDAVARVPYLSFQTAQAPDGCGYISYDDEQSIGEKASYVKSEGLGGVIVWEINEGYLGSASEKNPLLVAIHDSLLK